MLDGDLCARKCLGHGVELGQAPGRFRHLPEAPEVVFTTLHMGEEDPRKPIISQDTARASAGLHHLGGREVAAPEVLLEAGLELDTAGVGVTPEAAQHIACTRRLDDEEVVIAMARFGRPSARAPRSA